MRNTQIVHPQRCLRTGRRCPDADTPAVRNKPLCAPKGLVLRRGDGDHKRLNS